MFVSDKNSSNLYPPSWRHQAVFYSLLLMVLSLFISRVFLSVSLMAFFGLTIVHKGIGQQLKAFISTPFLWLFSLLFFIPFVSGLWSADAGKWADVVRIKLPLLFFPVAFAGQWKPGVAQWRTAACLLLAVVFIGCLWGLADFALHPQQIIAGYLRAKTIITPLQNDHVRFSWLVSVALILGCLLAQGSIVKWQRMLLLLLTFFFLVYLHLLAARTGLLSAYVFMVLYAGSLLLQAKQRRVAVGLLVTVCMLPLLAYVLLPTFRARLGYNMYDLSFVKKAAYLPGSSDGARTMSLKAGWQVLQQHPFGAGAGDVMTEADKWYAANVPQVLPTDKFYPSSEWLMYGAFAGWAGVLLFTVIMVLPFFMGMMKYRIYWIALHASALISLAIDMGLEVQYGVFLYGFIVMSWWKACHTEPLVNDAPL